MSIRHEGVRREAVQVPADAGELDGAREDVFDNESEQNEIRKGWRRFRVAIGVGMATVVAAGVTIMGVKAFGGGDADPHSLKGSDKETSAPLAPGQGAEATPTPSATETAPTEAVETDPSQWTKKNIPIVADIDGDGKNETYVGVEAYVDAMSIKATDGPDWWKDAGEQLVGRTNAAVNWGNSQEARDLYANYGTADGQYLGIGAVARNHLDAATKDALIAPIEGDTTLETANPDGWFNTQMEMAGQTSGRWWRSVRHGGEPYHFEYAPDTSKGENQMVLQYEDEENGIAVFTMFLGFEDNTNKAKLDSDETPVEGNQAWHVAMQKQPDGTVKVVGIQTEAYEK